jgi:gliding motility-associated-like protein
MTSSIRCARPKTASTNVQLNAVPGPEPVLMIEGDSIICVNSPITIKAVDNAASTATTTYRWYRGVTPLSETSLTLSNVNISGVYTIRANNGICAEIESSNKLDLDVRQIPKVDANAGGENVLTGFEGDVLQLNGSHTGLDATWSSSNGNGAIIDPKDMTTNLITENNGGKYWIVLTSTNGPCVAKDTVSLSIRIKLQAPNVFTVNGDGVNETFKIKGIETYDGALVMIFNRWGDVVYQSSHYESAEWDGGTYPVGVYYYIIENTDGIKHTGVVHLIR